MKVKDLIKMLADFPEDSEVFVSVDFDSALGLDGARVFGKLMSDINPHHDEVYLLAHADSVNFDMPPEDEVNKGIDRFKKRSRKGG